MAALGGHKGVRDLHDLAHRREVAIHAVQTLHRDEDGRPARCNLGVLREHAQDARAERGDRVVLEGIERVLRAALCHAVARGGMDELVEDDGVPDLGDGPPERDVGFVAGVAEEGGGGAEEVLHARLEGDVG